MTQLPSKNYTDSFKSHLKIIIHEESKGQIDITSQATLPVFSGLTEALATQGLGRQTGYGVSWSAASPLRLLALQPSRYCRLLEGRSQPQA